MAFLKHIQSKGLLFLKLSVPIVTYDKTFRSNSDLTWKTHLPAEGLNLILHLSLSCSSGSMSALFWKRTDIGAFINK